MKRSKSGAQKRKEAATARDAVAKLPKMTDFFKITEQSRPGTSTERDEENYSVQEKEDYDNQHQSDCEFPENVSCDLPANTQPSISKISESQFTPIPDQRRSSRPPQTPQLGGPRPTLGAKVSLKLLFGYVTIFSSADLFTTDLNCRKKLACDIISECNVILSRTI